MNVLVINCGSSSLKYQLIEMEHEVVIAKGQVERIGIEGSKLTQKADGKNPIEILTPVKNHTEAMRLVFRALTDEENGVIKDASEITAIGHRVLHGGEKLAESILVDEKVMEVIREMEVLGPLHIPANIMGIEACEAIAPGVPNVAVFDTAFHQTMPAKNFMYAIPYDLYKKWGLRKYGFHGTSHRYITLRMKEILGRDDINIISCHLGNGSSIAAVKDGKCFDTTMGLTPLEGLVMGTRTGDIDATIVGFLMDKENMTADEVNNLLNKKSGVLGVSGVSSDFRDLEDAANSGNEKAKLALDMFNQRVIKYIGAYATELGQVDAIVFTGGIGENSTELRLEICQALSILGVKMNEELGRIRGKEALLSAEDSRIAVWTVPTNEELMIARDTRDLVR